MILTEGDILEILGKPRNPYIKEWREKHEVLDLFCHGGDVTGLLEKVKNFENENQRKLRQKLARSTKDLTSYLLKPMDKVFSASGGNTDVEGSSSVVQIMKDHMTELPQGMSLRDWMRSYWMDAYITDPNGVILVELEDGKAYPTYKSIKVVHDYIKKWDAFEYLVLEMGKREVNGKNVNVFRVIDEQTDGCYYVMNKQLYPYSDGEKEAVIEHNYGFVPAINPSNVHDKQTGGRLSFIHPIDEVLMEYLRDSSVHTIYKFLHGFPKYWQYATKCITCTGTGKIKDPNDANTKIKCPTCSGSGLKSTHDVSDGINIPLPKEGQSIKLAPDLAGFVQPALETWDMQLKELDGMRYDMHFSLWGTVVEEEKSNTATGRFIDVQPVNDTLDKISGIGEWANKHIVDFMGKIMFKDMYSGNTTKWGRRYMIETPDMLWNKYIDAKQRLSPISALDYFYKQFLAAEYHNDLPMMEQKIKEFSIEPFPHYSLSDLHDAASPAQLQKKILFSEWNSREDVDYTKDLETLRTEFEAFYEANKENLVRKDDGTMGMVA